MNLLKKRIRKSFIKWQVWRGKAVDIWSKSSYPANVLSNLHNNGFCFGGIECGSMEGFLQSLKQKDVEKQRQVCCMTGKEAKSMTNTDWQTNQIVWWKGRNINRQSEAFRTLIKSAYEAMFEQNEYFRTALMSSCGKVLYHSQGEQDFHKTILTEQEFCGILMGLRDSYDLWGKTKEYEKKSIRKKKRMFVDMDNVLVDFRSGLDFQSDDIKKEYEGRLDEIPGLFAEMKPMPGAIEAMHTLQEYFDLYILSTAPWKNPSAWSDKVKWVTRYLDDIFHKRMVITHCKNLCKGDYLIDDRGKNGTSAFEGEWIQFGSSDFPDWESVVMYLLTKTCCSHNNRDSRSGKARMDDSIM